MCTESMRLGKLKWKIYPMPEPSKEDEGPQVAGEATLAMHDVANFHEAHENTTSFEELVSSLNIDQKRVFQLVKYHLEHQLQHEIGGCKCTDMKPLHMFVSGVGGTGKSFFYQNYPCPGDSSMAR